MIRYQLTVEGSGVEVSLDSRYPDEENSLQWSGDAGAIALVQGWLSSQSGFYGHLIGNSCTPLDLASAMNSVEGQRFLLPILVEGQGILELPQQFPLPPGAIP